MLKKTIISFVLIISSCNIFAQSISPIQLQKLFTLWQKGAIEEIEAYMNALSPKWQTEASLIYMQEDKRSITWLFKDSSPSVGALQVNTLRSGTKYIDKVMFVTDKAIYRNQYLSSIKSLKCELVSYTNEGAGKQKWIYRDSDTLYLITIDQQATKSIYTFALQGNNTN
ncbi:hypothetical protein ABIB62_003010 [Mucilaginibacter sp. UYP25]|uniref:hypothetical protein n=1 Tax=unclassified Mucilaginibacter TaxID=2617802 RepID=UPI003391FC42